MISCSPLSKRKEMKLLKKIGLRNDEISYLIWLKNKQKKSLKWN